MKKCFYDYQNSCTCADDDNCGCTFDNNIAHDVSCEIDFNETLKNPNKFSHNSSQNLQKHSSLPKHLK